MSGTRAGTLWWQGPSMMRMIAMRKEAVCELLAIYVRAAAGSLGPMGSRAGLAP